MSYDLSVLIPARCEKFLNLTVEDVLKNARAATEVIVILDGEWPTEPLQDRPNLTIVHHAESIGQRAATNEAARISQAKYVMKLDAHCAVDEGFDVKLMEDCEPDWTMIPAMYNFHIFDWKCLGCGNQTYQGAQPEKCKCGHTEFEMIIIWQPRWNRKTVSWRFDKEMHFKYWKKHKRRPECKGDLIETMSCIGCCFFMERKRFWELDGMDEGHGSWGGYGTELACKAWLSGGKLITSKKTWQAHLFRTGNFKAHGQSSFPYPLSGRAQQRARDYSQNLWLHDRWPKAKHPLSWLIEKFAPIPDWHEGAK